MKTLYITTISILIFVLCSLLIKNANHINNLRKVSIILIVIIGFTSKSSYSSIYEDKEIIDTSANSIDMGVSYIGDFIKNYNGGITAGNTYLGKFDFELKLNTEMVGLWEGGSVSLLATAVHGGLPSEEFIGDYQVASDIEAGKHQYIEELFYKQEWVNVNLKAGVQDINCEFAVGNAARNFINSSFGIHPTITGNVPVSTYPLTSLGAAFDYFPWENFSMKTGLFDGHPGEFNSDPYRTKWELSREEGFMSITEFVYNLDNQFYMKAGGYYHNHCEIPAQINEGMTEHSSNYGFYLIAEKNWFSVNNTKFIDVFIQLGSAPKSTNINPFYMGGGLVIYPSLENKYINNYGVGLAHACFNEKIVPEARQNNCESTLEGFVTLGTSDGLNLKPCLQYIMNPGFQEDIPDAFVGMLRVDVNF